jgi:aminoglycoside phosphotransferase (APT) family kinase protein
VRPTADLPDDPTLPGIVAIRAAGLAGAIPALGLGDGPVELLLCGYTAGSRATLEVRAGNRRFAVKAYAEDPTQEGLLYQALAAAGLAGDSGPRVPPLLVWERELRVLVIGWLEGTPLNQLIKDGQGQRAGELAARWLWRAATLPVKLGPPFGTGRTLYQVGKSVAALGAADAALGPVAKAIANVLGRTQPREGAARLVHGTLYARHVLDLGDGPGVIDWQRFGQGPVELDAGMFLATVSRLRLRHAAVAREAARAEETFLTGTRGLLDQRALAWHRAAALLHLASRLLKREPPAEARVLLDEAGQLASGAQVDAPALPLKDSALELMLQALSTRPATPSELDQIRKLLERPPERASGRPERPQG